MPRVPRRSFDSADVHAPSPLSAPRRVEFKDRLSDAQKKIRLLQSELEEKDARLQKVIEERNDLRRANQHQGGLLQKSAREVEEERRQKVDFHSRLIFVETQLRLMTKAFEDEKAKCLHQEAERKRATLAKVAVEAELAATVTSVKADQLTKDGATFLNVHVPLQANRVVDDILVFTPRSAEEECYMDEAAGVFCDHLFLSRDSEGKYSIQKQELKKRKIRASQSLEPAAKRTRTE